RAEFGGEQEEDAAVGDGEVDGSVAGVEEGAVEARGGPEGPARRRGVGIPRAHACGPVTFRPRLRAGASSGLDRHAEATVECAVSLGSTVRMAKFTVYLYGVPAAQDLHSFPTRRSSDLAPNSEANRKKMLPSATAKLTDPLPALRRAPSRLAAVPRAQLGDAES